MNSPFEFPLWISQAMLSLVKKTIKTLAQTQNSYGHSFYITFITIDKKTIIPKELLAQFPEIMTIVLEHQFSNLKYESNGFYVDLSFNGVSHSLYVPFNSIINFSDKLSHINIILDYHSEAKKDSSNKKETKKTQNSNKDNIIIFPKS